MNGNLIPTELNWVRARAECTIYQVFKRLEAEVREDVQVRQQSLAQDARTNFKFQAASSKSFTVTREDQMYPVPKAAAVDFALEANCIRVFDGTTLDFSIEITLNNEGRCKMKISDIEYEDWQIRRKALEKLFFDPL